MTGESPSAVVVGAGLVGAVQALLLARNGYQVTVVERRSLRCPDTVDEESKTVALSARSRQLLEAAELWPDINPCPIKSVHVSEKGKYGSVKIAAQKLNLGALGYVVSNTGFEVFLHERLRHEPGIELIENAQVVSLEQNDKRVCLVLSKDQHTNVIEADVLVAADGTQSTIRSLLNIAVTEHDYHQCAVLANVVTSKSHDCNAYERFTGSGPLALLPLAVNEQNTVEESRYYSMVFTAPEADMAMLKNLSDGNFLQLLQKTFGGKCGRFEKIGKRFITPLKLTVSEAQTHGRCALIGNAARTLHPVAGQGLNLALRDVFELASGLSDQSVEIATALESFSTARRRDQQLITRQTDLLARAFLDRPFPFQSPVSVARHASLLLLDFVEPVKNRFAHLNMGQHVSLPIARRVSGR